jgi:cytidylate kinase
MKRELATQMGMNIIQFNQLGELPENKSTFDLQYEEYQMKLDPRKKIILDGRLSFYCQPQAFKVLLQIDPQEAARRIFDDKRDTDNYVSVEEVLKISQERNA